MEANNLADESIAVVNECVEHLQKLVKLKGGASVTSCGGCIKNLLHVITLQEKAMKYFTSSDVGGIPLLVLVLEHTQDLHIKQTIVMIMKEVMSRKSVRNDRVLALAASGASNHLLKLIVKSHQPFNFSDDFVSSLYSVTAKIGKKDKKFAMKARLLGVLPVIITHIRFYGLRPKVLNSVLMLLKRVLISAVNAIHLSKADLIPQLLTFLDPPRRKMTLSVMYSLEAISLATRSKQAARQFVKQEVTVHLLQVLSNPTHSPGTNRVKTNRMIRAYSAVLHTFAHMTQIKSGRESLCLAGAVPILLNWCRIVVHRPEPQYDRMMGRASIILQRCMPPHPLPVTKFSSPVVFSLPDHKLPEQVEYSESKTDVSDSDSQVSSNSSSSDSGDESDQDSEPITDGGINSTDCIRQYKCFFEELKEDKETKAAQSGPAIFCEDCVHFQEKLVFESHEPEPFHKRHMALNAGDQKSPGNSSCFSVEIPPTQRLDRFSTNKVDQLSSKSCDMSPSKQGHTFCSNSDCSPTKIISCVNISKTKNDKKCSFTSSEVRNLIDSAKEESRSKKFLETVNTSELYHKFANRTVSVLPFVKIAYPDTKCCITYDDSLVKLKKFVPSLVRKQIVKHLEEMNNEVPYKEIFNLDNLLYRNMSSCNPLLNTDEERISTLPTSDHLSFESRFESGNLRKVYWKGGAEYDLILNPDVNCVSHHQWFYFETAGVKADTPYTFNILNMEKPASLFNEGMCPVVFSVKTHMNDRKGWMRMGTDICYFRNHYIQGASALSSIRDKPYYTLTFTISFQYDNDVCYIAYHYPYTYSALQTHLECWLSSYDKSSVYCKKDDLCKTLAGNPVPLLTITAKPTEGNRQYIFLTARVHPGESNASWAMKGTLDFLFSNKPSAQRLREMFIFKIVPMLNPDGVINGCHRCSLSGQDLNRQWITPNVNVHPTIFYTKTLLYYLNSMGRKPLAYCDYHGHSRRHNVFLYGCNPQQSWWSSDEAKPDCESFKMIPLLMHYMVPTFGLEQCCFSIERSRESTGRVTVWRQFDVPLSYTMECTYGGCDQGLYEGYHVGIVQLEETGTKFCQCFGKIMPRFEGGPFLQSSMPIDTSILSKPRPSKNQEVEKADSFSSSLSEDDLVEYEDGDQHK